MKLIKFILLGKPNIGKSTLIDCYLWKVFFGYAYHDHVHEAQRYQIETLVIECLTQLKLFHKSYNESDEYTRSNQVNIYFVCFSVADKCSFKALTEEWLPEVMLLNQFNDSIFVLGLQSDLRDRMLLKCNRGCIRQKKALRLCSRSDNLIYLECTSTKTESVRYVFEYAIGHVMYNKNCKLVYESEL